MQVCATKHNIKIHRFINIHSLQLCVRHAKQRDGKVDKMEMVLLPTPHKCNKVLATIDVSCECINSRKCIKASRVTPPPPIQEAKATIYI